MSIALSLTIIGLVIAVVGLGVRIYLWYLSLGRANLSLMLDVHEEEVDSRSSLDSRSMHVSHGDRDIWAEIQIKSTDSRPVTLTSTTVGVPRFQHRQWPLWVHRLLGAVHMEVDSRATTFPITLSPSNETDITIRGLEVSNQLKHNGYQGEVTVIFQVLDERDNSYLVGPTTVDIDHWQQDRGKAVITFIDSPF
jgi:hypothetical protein